MHKLRKIYTGLCVTCACSGPRQVNTKPLTFTSYNLYVSLFVEQCTHDSPTNSSFHTASQLKLTEIKEKVGSLERLLERDVAKSAAAVSTTSLNQDRALPDDAEEENLPALEDEKDLEPTPLAVVDAAYGEDGEDDDLLDLGIQMGKMRITERIGGFFRPKISQEVCFQFTIVPVLSNNTFYFTLPSNSPTFHFLKRA